MSQRCYGFFHTRPVAWPIPTPRPPNSVGAQAQRQIGALGKKKMKGGGGGGGGGGSGGRRRRGSHVKERGEEREEGRKRGGWVLHEMHGVHSPSQHNAMHLSLIVYMINWPDMRMN